MKKIITFFVAGIFALNFSAKAQVLGTSATAPAAPAVESLGLKETVWDFGKIPQGKPVTHVFDVVNNGTDSLRIANVQASCGCTTPDWERNKAIAPGQTTKITVGYNAAAEGPFTKFITISYNGAQSKQITIKGEVWKTPVSSAPENKAASTLKEKE
ncbi:MAG: hypothetical protein RLY16_377 [Bacteroidota bacterium]|jgi:hypothetical protein